MAEGALKNSRAQLTFSVTGIAGPGGGSPEKPVGTVCMGFQRKGLPAEAEIFHFPGNRHEVRQATVKKVFQVIISLLKE